MTGHTNGPAGGRPVQASREDLYRAIFEHPTESTVVLNAVRDDRGAVIDWRYFDLNANALSVLELPREQVIGNLVSVVIPDRAARLIPLCAKVLSSRTPHQYSAEAGDRSFEVCIYPIGEHTVVSTGVDVTARRVAERLEVARGEAERAEREWLAAVLDSISEEVYFTDTSGRYSYANPAALREFGHSSLSGVPLIDVVTQLEVFRLDGTPRPVEDAPPLRALRGEVVRDEGQIVRTPRTGELRYRQVSSAPVRDATGRIIGAVSVVRDLTAQRRTESALQARESRASALLALADRFRDVTDPGDIATGASTLLGEVLAIDRCGYGELDMATETVQIGPHWSTARVPPVGGCYHLRRYGSFVDDLKAGRLVVVEDTRTDPRTASDAAALEGLGVRSLVNVPIVESGRCVAMFFLNHSTPRHWSAEELQFIQEVADRTRFAAERRRHEQSIATELRLNSLLRDLGAKIVLEGEASKLFDEAVAAAMEITGASGGTLQLMDPTGTRLLLATVRGIDRALSDQFRVVDARSGSSCGVALARGKRTMVDFDVPPEQDPDGSSRKHRAHGLRCAQSTPLVSRSGQPLGMISTHWTTLHVLDEREIRFLDLLARQVADLIEKTRAEQALRQQQHELRAADRRKDEFLALLAHELRNPLVPIRTGVELLKQVHERPGVLDQIRPMMERQTLHMVRLIDDLLDVSRITAGKIQLQRDLVPVGEIVGTAIEANRAAIDRAHLELEVRVEDPMTRVFVDSTRIAQVITNLLHNATKFTPAGGRLCVDARVTTSGEQRLIEIGVSDTGIGLSPDMLPRIFDLFVQVEEPGKRTHGGLGIGLAIARSLVHLHGGSLVAHSDGLGHGTRFVIQLPVAADRGRTPVGAEPRAGRLEGRRVLVVDDNRDGADSMALLIRGLGADVAVAYDGASGLESLASFEPEIVLLDIGMPLMDGFETCRRMRVAEQPPRHLVALTGWGQQRDKDLALQAGFDAHITKPAAPSDLMHVIAQLDAVDA